MTEPQHDRPKPSCLSSEPSSAAATMSVSSRSSISHTATTIHPNRNKKTKKKKLGIIFDTDGTLVGEKNDILRPGAIEFLRWLLDRGHRLALWTAAHESWAETNAQRICRRVVVHDDDHDCSPVCRKTFSFAWGRSRMRSRKEMPKKLQNKIFGSSSSASSMSSWDGECVWCGPYGKRCHRCYCCYYVWDCPCRHVKDLRLDR